jgi:hypothetical protein
MIVAANRLRERPALREGIAGSRVAKAHCSLLVVFKNARFTSKLPRKSSASLHEAGWLSRVGTSVFQVVISQRILAYRADRESFSSLPK